MPNINTSIFVFVQHWPSLSFSSLSLGCKKLTTVLDEISLKGRLELEKSLVGITVCRRNEILQELHALKDPHCLFLQGSVNYLMGILSALPKSKALEATVLVTEGNGRRLNAFGLQKFTKVHHKHVGRALEHCWWVG